VLHNIIERKNVSTQIKAMSKIRHTAVFEIKQRIDKLFALFTLLKDLKNLTGKLKKYRKI